MTRRENLSSWRSAKAEQRFRERVDAMAEQRLDEVPPCSMVPTKLGPTATYRWPGRGDPIVLLHGTSGNALTWGSFAARRNGRAMIGIDTIGDVGRSRQQRPVEDAAALAAWLDETLAGLGLDHAHLCGTSYGGFLALNIAARRPARVRSLFLMEPAGLVRVQMARFMAWGLGAMVASLLPGPVRRRAAKPLRMPALEEPELLRLAFYANRHHRARLLRPEPLTDEQLRSIDQPVTMVLGAKSEVFDPAEVQSRAEHIGGPLTVDVVEDAGHAVQLSAEERLADLLVATVDRLDAERSMPG